MRPSTMELRRSTWRYVSLENADSAGPFYVANVADSGFSNFESRVQIVDSPERCRIT